MRFIRAGIQPRGIGDDVVISAGTYSILPGRTHVASPTSLQTNVNLKITLLASLIISITVLEKEIPPQRNRRLHEQLGRPRDGFLHQRKLSGLGQCCPDLVISEPSNISISDVFVKVLQQAAREMVFVIPPRP